MENRIAKVIVGSAGGTAGAGARTYKIALPSKWVTALGIDNGQIDLCFDGEKITVSPRLSFDEFVGRKRTQHHHAILLSFYNGDTLCTRICADYTDRTVAAENYTADIVKTAFGRNCNPSWGDFENFLEERCVPRQRSGIREYLDALGLDMYDPIQIIAKTEGRMAEDDQWIKMEVLQ